MRGVPVPDRGEDFAADASELFFDLVFVFAFARLVYHLVHHPTWEGTGQFALLFTMVWLPWTQFTWSANAVAGNSRPVRALFLVATVASVPMAGSVSAALDTGGPAFALSVSVILSMGLFTMISGLGHDQALRASIVRYSIPNWIAIAVMVTGGFVPGGYRVALWWLAMAIVFTGTVRAGSSEWLIRPGHFAERHALIVIVALGEVIVALGLPVANALTDDDGVGLAAGTVLALVAAGVFAGLLWWSYFDRPSPALEHRHESIEGGNLRGRYARDVYTYAHFPLVAGIILATAGLESITLHPADPLPVSSKLFLAGGLALYLTAVTAAVVRAFRAVALERLVAVVALALVVGLSGDLDGIITLVLVDVVLAVMLVVEHYRVERWSRTVPVPTRSGRRI